MARSKQVQIPGTEAQPAIPELQEILEDLRVCRAERIDIQQKEKALQDKALAYRRTMTTPIDIYRYVDEDNVVRVARFKAVIKVSVRSEKSDDADDGDDDDTSSGDEDVSVQ